MTVALESLLSESEPLYGVVPGALFNELQREWQIQKSRADGMAQVLEAAKESVMKLHGIESSGPIACEHCQVVRNIEAVLAREGDKP